MPFNRTCTLNGVTLYPSEVTELARRVGQVLEADDGSKTLIHRGSKRGWELSWESPYPAIVDAVRALYVLTSTLSFTDPLGASYTVIIPPDGYSADATHRAAGSTAGTTYGLSLTILEV